MYQLQSSNIDEHTLRRILVSYFQERPYINGTHYRDYLLQPVPSIDPYNADTEASTNEDAYIATVSDPNTQAQLCWVKYLERLSNGTWGDHNAMQGICEMLNITINVLSTQNPTMTPIVPTSGTSNASVYIGLIE